MVCPALFLLACPSQPKDSETTDDSGTTDSDTTDDTGTAVDADGDGSPAAGDCDDSDAAVNPGATEVCDGIDNDCDGLTDSADDSVTGTSTFYADADGDGYGGIGGAGVCGGSGDRRGQQRL